MAVRYAALCRKVHVCHCNSLGGATWRSITGRTDRQTDGQTECDAICFPRSPSRLRGDRRLGRLNSRAFGTRLSFAVPSLCPWRRLCWQQSHLQRVASFFFGNITRKTHPCVQKILHRFWWQFQFRRAGFLASLIVGELVCRRVCCRRVGLSASWTVGELVCRRVVHKARKTVTWPPENCGSVTVRFHLKTAVFSFGFKSVTAVINRVKNLVLLHAEQGPGTSWKTRHKRCWKSWNTTWDVL